ncbi:hypothetical protein VP01_1951g2 [Puccinia sorghi]|uniref:DUF7872 domain-containing protein n=1 Tax=Puccinia sorghi TaxID=27349 RepID=A0A0L6VC18_9BASI|nr:hypothetical protein VP01_1951g2 [Puccinia sorghi]
MPGQRCHSDGSNSLFPECQTACAGLISTWISSFPSSLFKAIGPLSDSIWYSWGALSWIGIVMISYQISAIGWLETLVLVKEGESRFKRSSSISWMLGEAQNAAQEIISNITQEVLKAGVSTDKGLASLNRDGIFLSGTPVTDRQTLQKEYQKILMLKTLVKIWRDQNVFIARGAVTDSKLPHDRTHAHKKEITELLRILPGFHIVEKMPCTLFYDQIVGQVAGNGFDQRIYGGFKVERKYGFTIEYLTTNSWECQKKYAAFDFEPRLHQNMTDIRNWRRLEDCIVNLPVCDCTRPDMKEALQKGFSITKACREVSGLPI